MLPCLRGCCWCACPFHPHHHTTATTITIEAEGIRRVPPAEETQRRLAEEEAGAGASKEWCLEAGFNPEKLKVGLCALGCCWVLEWGTHTRIYTHTYIHKHTFTSAGPATSWRAWCSWRTRPRRRVGFRSRGALPFRVFCVDPSIDKIHTIQSIDLLTFFPSNEWGTKTTAGEALVDECRRCCQAGGDAAKVSPQIDLIE